MSDIIITCCGRLYRVILGGGVMNWRPAQMPLFKCLKYALDLPTCRARSTGASLMWRCDSLAVMDA